MSKLSDDEQLVKLILIQAKIMPYWSQDDDDNMKKLLSRLERGRIAIEAMDNIGLCISVLNDFNVKYKMNNIIDIYQQSRKEVTDGN